MKDRQQNGQQKKDKKKNNEVHYTKNKLKITDLCPFVFQCWYW